MRQCVAISENCIPYFQCFSILYFWLFLSPKRAATNDESKIDFLRNASLFRFASFFPVAVRRDERITIELHASGGRYHLGINA